MDLKHDSASRNLLVASIDFGTTFSGWAYSFYHDFKTDPSKGYCKQWHSGSGSLVTEKTPTVVLVKPDGKTLEAFGYEAENRYKELTDEDEHRDYYYFRKFKMKLLTHLSQKISRNFLIDDELGRSLPALEVFAMAIKYLVDDLHKSISSKVTGVIARSNVHWVLTVPAIWTDQAKQFIREAAEKAGIASDKLSIALEPEAASVYCRHLPIDKSVGNLSISALPVGTKYMILDAGGGTIDITVHEVVDDVSVKEVTAACGGGWGGTLVDQAFENLVVDLVGRDVFCKFRTEETEDYLELMRDFEVKKRNIRPEKEGRVMMRFPASLVRMSENNGRNIALYVGTSSKYSGKIDFVSDKIKFHTDIFKQLFEYSYSKTLEHVEDVLKQNNLHDLNLILMVGGYSESPMLQQAVKNAYPTIRVVIPNEASSAIMKGALIFGHRPEFISQRVLKYTYGIESNRPFIEGHHPEYRRIKTDTGDFCGIFDKHVEKGQIVRIGEVQMKKVYSPLNDDQNQMMFPIFSSLMQNPEYTDVGCSEIGVLTVEIAKGDTVEVSFTFGGTEIKVEALNQITGEKRKVAIDLLS